MSLCEKSFFAESNLSFKEIPSLKDSSYDPVKEFNSIDKEIKKFTQENKESNSKLFIYSFKIFSYWILK